MEVFLHVPETESRVAGLTIEVEHFSENIAEDSCASALLDEHLKLIVDHDGSNLFCDSENCFWGFIFAAAAIEEDVRLATREDDTFTLYCLPYGVRIEKAVIQEEVLDGILGIWLLLFFDDDPQPDVVFVLKQYMAE
jgi:hypothetical protein